MKFVSPDRFLILTRLPGPAPEHLRAMLTPLGQVEAVVDTAGGEGVWYADSEVAGYQGLMGQTNVFPPLTAWSRAFYHLSLTLGEEEAVWFIEEDVAGSAECWEALGRLTEASGADLAAWDVRSREEDPGWYFWHTVGPRFPAGPAPGCRGSWRGMRWGSGLSGLIPKTAGWEACATEGSHISRMEKNNPVGSQKNVRM